MLEIGPGIELKSVDANRLITELLGITRIVIDILNGKAGKRVRHLALHARKARTRKKNIRRAFRMCEGGSHEM